MGVLRSVAQPPCALAFLLLLLLPSYPRSSVLAGQQAGAPHAGCPGLVLSGGGAEGESAAPSPTQRRSVPPASLHPKTRLRLQEGEQGRSEVTGVGVQEREEVERGVSDRSLSSHSPELVGGPTQHLNGRVWLRDAEPARKLGPESRAGSNTPRAPGSRQRPHRMEVRRAGRWRCRSLRDAGTASCGLLIESSSAKCLQAAEPGPNADSHLQI